MIICEPICSNKEHIPINVSLIEELTLYHSHQAITFLCTPEYWEELKKNLSTQAQAKLQHHSIKVLCRKDNLIGWRDSFLLIRQINKLRKKDHELLIFLSSTSGIIGLSRVFLSKFNVKCFIHLVLARIDYVLPRNPFSAWFTIEKTLIRLGKKSCEIVVLENHIVDNLKSRFSHISSFIKCVPHPIALNIPPQKHLVLKDEGPTICFPGSFSLQKGADLFYNLARYNHQNENRYNMVVAGKMTTDLTIDFKQSIFSIPPASSFISRKEFSSILNLSHFVFLGQDQKIYKWVASGVYLDALSYKKPIIALRNAFFESEFSKYGEFGFLFESIEDLIHTLNTKLTPALYNKFITNITKAKKGREKSFNNSLTKLLK